MGLGTLGVHVPHKYSRQIHKYYIYTAADKYTNTKLSILHTNTATLQAKLTSLDILLLNVRCNALYTEQSALSEKWTFKFTSKSALISSPLIPILWALANPSHNIQRTVEYTSTLATHVSAQLNTVSVSTAQDQICPPPCSTPSVGSSFVGNSLWLRHLYKCKWHQSKPIFVFIMIFIMRMIATMTKMMTKKGRRWVWASVHDLLNWG